MKKCKKYNGVVQTPKAAGTSKIFQNDLIKNVIKKIDEATLKEKLPGHDQIHRKIIQFSNNLASIEKQQKIKEKIIEKERIISMNARKTFLKIARDKKDLVKQPIVDFLFKFDSNQYNKTNEAERKMYQNF